MKLHSHIRRLVVGVAFIVSPLLASAQALTDSVSVNVYFRYGYSLLDLAYRRNGERLEEFVRRYEALRTDDKVEMGSITVKGFASPDGDYRMNQRLSEKRAKNIGAHVQERLGLGEQSIQIQACGIDWEGLEQAVDTMRGQNIGSREKVLDILRNTPELGTVNGCRVELRKQKLLQLNGGREWRYVRSNIFPYLRNSAVTITISYEKSAREDSLKAAAEAARRAAVTADSIRTAQRMQFVADSLAAAQADSLLRDSLLADSLAHAKKLRHTVVALRSNLLLPLLNVGVEVPIGNRWSVGADYYYPWMWRRSNHRNCFQLIFVSAEVRYWFGQRTRENRLQGHSVAAYGAWGYYDVEHKYSGHQGDCYSAGVDYVYAMPIFKGRMHLEFQFGLGYIGSKAQPYDVFEEGGRLMRRPDIRKNFSYFGPTKIGVSLVLPLKKVTRKEVAR